MNRKLTNHFLIAIFLLLNSMLIQSQVAIGLAEAPVEGALLQLKNIKEPPNTFGGANANKGVLLPRVSLGDINKLKMGDGDEIVGDERDKHVGLVVYNVNESAVSLCKGIYIWMATKWQRIPEPCNKSEWEGDYLLFYKSALVAKNINLELSREPYAVSWQDDGGIPWRSGGFPSNISRSITEEFAFQPEVNDTGIDRVATVSAIVDLNGDVSTQQMTIKQLAREMIFTPTQTGFLPAIGADTPIAIESEADWTATSRDLSNTMITSYPSEEQAKGQMNFNLNISNNLTWQARSTVFDITSSDPDFLPRTLEVKQDYARPYVKDFSATTLALGAITANVAKSITFNSNAKWKISASTGHYSDIVLSPSVAVNTIVANATATPIAGKSQAYSFTASGNVDAIAGTNYSTTLTFETVTGTTDVAKQDVTISRSVPIRWVNPKVNTAGLTSLPRTGASVDTEVYTNHVWSRGAGTLATNGDQVTAASVYGKKIGAIAIKNNDWWDARNVTFAIWYAADKQTSQTLSQVGYHLAPAAHNVPTSPASIPFKAHSSYYVNLTSNNGAPAGRIGINTAANVTGTWFSLKAVTRDTNMIFEIPENKAQQARTLYFFYEKAGKTWERIGSTVTQEGTEYHSFYTGTKWIWVERYDEGIMDWADGYYKCRNYKDPNIQWRLPTKAELEAMMPYRDQFNLFKDTGTFSDEGSFGIYPRGYAYFFYTSPNAPLGMQAGEWLDSIYGHAVRCVKDQ